MRYECGQCGAALAFARSDASDRAATPQASRSEIGVRTEVCPYCASPSFLERPAASARPDPVFCVPFAGDAAWARVRLDRWIGRRMIVADPALRRATVEALRGVYLPAYLYSAVARTEYTASIGEHYTETESYKKKHPDGTETRETRTVTRTEYRPLAGSHLGYITDVLVSASAGLDQRTFGRLEPYDLRALHRYSPALVSGWIQEEFSREANDCMRVSRGEAIDAVGDELRRFLPGDSHADLHWTTEVEWESLDPVLVPVWVLAVRYRGDREPLRVVINGQTGAVTGKVPLAWWKIALLVAAVAAIAAAIIWAVKT